MFGTSSDDEATSVATDSQDATLVAGRTYGSLDVDNSIVLNNANFEQDVPRLLYYREHSFMCPACWSCDVINTQERGSTTLTRYSSRYNSGGAGNRGSGDLYVGLIPTLASKMRYLEEAPGDHYQNSSGRYKPCRTRM